MRFHVVNLPHTQTTKAYSPCAYTQKVRKFADMMTGLGHEVILYGSEQNEAHCTENVVCITKARQKTFGYSSRDDYLKIDFNSDPIWSFFVPKVVEEMKKRVQPRDIICLITSTPFKPIMDAFPGHLSVEFGIGYPETMSPYRVFESYAWRNYVYGRGNEDGHFFDEVIPNYFEIKDFPIKTKKDDYFLYIGRLTDKKGWHIAQQVCKELDKRLVVAGPGEFSGYGEYVGIVGPQKRAELMGKAKAVFVPTLYVAPFEGVHIEANLCGTPVITTDFGVFSETVGEPNGIRCSSYYEFLEAAGYYANHIKATEYYQIAHEARQIYSTQVVAKRYEEYFKKLLTLYQDGWYNTGDITGDWK